MWCDLLGSGPWKTRARKTTPPLFIDQVQSPTHSPDISHETCSLWQQFLRLPKASSWLWRFEKQKESFLFSTQLTWSQGISRSYEQVASSQCGPADNIQREPEPHHVSTETFSPMNHRAF